MELVTCPEYGCLYNGFGECQLGAVHAGLWVGSVTEALCPYFTPAGPDAAAPGEGPAAGAPGEELAAEQPGM